MPAPEKSVADSGISIYGSWKQQRRTLVISVVLVQQFATVGCSPLSVPVLGTPVFQLQQTRTLKYSMHMYS